MKNVIIFFCLIITLCLQACTSSSKEKQYTIGVSQCVLNDAWRQSMIKELMIEASNYDNIKIIVKDANNSNERQIDQIRELMGMKVDVLIISPFESEAITPIAEEAYKAGIPTIITDRKINSDFYTSFVGADNYAIGFAAGEYAAIHVLPGSTVLEVWGLKRSSPARERHQGFIDAMKARTDVRYESFEGDWLYKKTRNLLPKQTGIDRCTFIYCHNDMMAIAAREVTDSINHNRSKEKTQIIGVDATAGAGLEAVADGRIDVSFLYPTGAEELIKISMDIINGKPVPKKIALQTSLIDMKSARNILLATKQLQNYQKRIEGQRSKIDQLFDRFVFLRSSLTIISALMIAFVLLSVYAFFINRKMQRVNKKLIEKNKKEEEQNKKLISLNAEIEQVTAQKLQFFTNVSHEVRTPLTLILGPLDRLIRLLHNSPYLPDLELMHKNADRLLRVINQILDFRKVESNQQELKIEQTELVSFVGEVKSYFENIATLRHITYTFSSEMKECFLWIDQDLMEKVLVNLLSNAFKFVSEGGIISLVIKGEGDKVIIEVEDNGCGIQPDKIGNIFNRFYTENSSAGTGIGLHLVKEYVSMHKGEIAVESTPGKKTVFTITLNRDKQISQGDNVREVDLSLKSYVTTVLDDQTEKNLLSQAYSYIILIVDDDEDVRIYLQRELQENFKILTASDGEQALDILKSEEVSLVLSDVMMPRMNGFELCREIKSDVLISHIPVVLLTALSDVRQQIYGVIGGADGYIRKPFHINYLKIKIIRLLEERKRLREQLLDKLQKGNVLQIDPEKIDSLDDVFLKRFMEQIEKVYSDSDYNIEKLSESLGLSRGHLHRKIKDLTGISPVEFLRNYRLNKAAVLLKQKNLNVNEIAYQTGFSSPAYFSKCFKTVYNKTPSEYQEED
ncbi:substrate-binding domain-containing protein [Bacteroides ihuae]|uniref:substrate-binding domain-containing protein n=1 Tax=Bacteroides ihuae TaxID=1852362 RepID=UPI0008D9C511|nr:substrate-binding domain-containing protein [Bacteroides ihuae]